MLHGIDQDKSKGSMDWIGALLITITLSLLNIGLGGSAEGGSTALLDTQSGLPPYGFSFLISAVIFLGLFLWRQKRAKFPLIDLSLFKRTNYLPANIINFLVGFSLFIAIANVPLYINSLIASTLEQGAWDSGWMLSALTVPMAIASILGGFLSDKKGYKFPAIIGLIVAFIGFMLMKTWVAETPYRVMVSHLLFGGIGIGLTMAPITAAVVNASPSDQRGVSSALVIIFRLIGMTIGVSSITTYGLHRAEILSKELLSSTADVGEIWRIGLEVTEQVISETFLIAGIVIILALVPTLLLKNKNNKSEV